MGRVDRPKGILKTTEISANVIPFNQDSNYYFQKGNYYHQKNKLSKALLFLKKAIEIEPGNARNHYNLACLLSKTSRLKEANQIFKHIVRNLNPELTECYFLMAINYGLMEDLSRAKRCLKKYLRISPEGEMAEEARDLLATMEEEEEEAVEFNRSLTVGENEALERAITDLSAEQLPELFRDKEFRLALQWGLFQGSDSLKEKIILLCGRARTAEANRILREYVISPWVKERLRQIALMELKHNCPGESCRAYFGGRFVEVNLGDYPLPAPVWQKEWQEVLNCTLANMRKNAYYGEEFFADARAIWLDYINSVYPEVPRIVKPQVWAAGLEYCLARFHFLNVTQKDLSRQYAVSPASVGQKYKRINEVLNIERKAYRNMLAFLAHRDREQN